MPPTASWAGQPALDAGLARAPAPGKPAAAAPTRKATHGRSWQREAAHAYGWGLAPALIVLGAITLLPLITLIVVSLTPLSLTNPAATFHFDAPLGNYAQLWHDERFLHSLWVWKIIYTPDISPAHALLEQWGWPLRSLIANPDTALWAIVAADVWQWFPFTMLMVLAQLQMVPRDPLDAARIDCANRWQVLRFIVLPYLQNTLVVCALFRLIDSFKAFPLLYVLTNGGPGTVTEVTNFYGFIQAFNFSYWGYGSAIAVVMLLIIFALSALISRLGQRAGASHGR